MLEFTKRALPTTGRSFSQTKVQNAGNFPAFSIEKNKNVCYNIMNIIREDVFFLKKITSFTVDHTKISEGMYISRIDGDITTYDLRMRKPNGGDYISVSAMHTMEHMFATFIRNSEIADDVIYFGPMGCQTGFYLLVRNADNEVVFKEIHKALEGILAYHGEVFGNSEIECGNYKTLSLETAHAEALRYIGVLDGLKDHSFMY